MERVCEISEKSIIPYVNHREIFRDFSLYSNFIITAYIHLSELKEKKQFSELRVEKLEIERESMRAIQVMQKKMNLNIRFQVKNHMIQMLQRVVLTEFEQFMLFLFVAMEMDEVIKNAIYQVFQGTITKSNIIELFEITQRNREKALEKSAMWSPDGKLCFEIEKNKVTLNSALKQYLIQGKIEQVEDLETLEPLIIYEEKLEQMLEILKSHADKNLVIHIYGAKSCGKSHMAKHMAKHRNQNILCVSFEQIKLLDRESFEKKLREILLFCVLEKGMVYLSGITELKVEKEKIMLQECLETIHKRCATLIIGSNGKDCIANHKFDHYLVMELQHLSVEEKIQAWDHFKQMFQAKDELDINGFGNKYVFNIGEIRNTYLTASALTQMKIGTEEIEKAVKMRGYGLEGANLVQTGFVFHDLIVEEEVKRQLYHVINQLKYKNIIYHEWGFDKKVPYGRGISTLFYGPPGTGKTMTASVIANELGLDLYKIDISKLVSKYIGETEKNISNLFEKAKNMNIILFFDEADALFAKRSEVKDSNDKNANAETAHLLQKLEEYEGISILATNLFDQIDDAFRRRIKFMIPFTLPDEETRKKLWNAVAPKEEFLEPDIDLDFFATNFELSGSQIKEIILNASYIAISENQKLGNEQIKEAVALNYQKYGKRLTKNEFGYLR